MEELTKLIIKWHHDRNLIDGSSDKDQVLKLAQELGELSDSVCKGKDVKDDLGDMMVVMLNIMERLEEEVICKICNYHTFIKDLTMDKCLKCDSLLDITE